MKSLENLKFPDNFMENPLSLNIIVAKFGDGTYVNVDQDVFFSMLGLCTFYLKSYFDSSELSYYHEQCKLHLFASFAVSKILSKIFHACI